MRRWLHLGALSGFVAASWLVACVSDEPGSGTDTADGGCTESGGCADGASLDGAADGGGGSDAGSDGAPSDGAVGCTGPCKGEVEWLRSFGSSVGESIFQTIVDGSGNVYIAAMAGAALGLGDNGGAPVVAPGLFIAKFGPDGKPKWAKELAGAVQANNLQLAAGAGGQIFVAGTYFKSAQQTVMWGGADTGLPTNVGSSGYDIFVLNVDASGALQGAVRIGADSYDEMRAIRVDVDGALVLFGQMAAGITYGTTPIPQGPFVMKMSSSTFDPTWVQSISVSSGSVTSSGIVSMAAGDLGVAGTYTGAATWNNASLPAPAPGAKDGFVMRLRGGTGATASSSSFALTYGNANPPVSMTTLDDVAYGGSPAPAVAVVGRFEGTVGLGNNIFLTAGDGGTMGNPGTYVARYDAITMKLLTYRGIFDDPTGYPPKQVGVDNQGNVSVGGTFRNTVDFGGGGVTSTGDTDGFVALYDPQLKKLLWSDRFGGPVGDSVAAMAVDPSSGAIVVSGLFTGTADFPSGKQMTSNGGAANVFLMKLAR